MGRRSHPCCAARSRVIYHLNLLSFGDNLISLSLLARLRDKSGVTIVGTALTQRIAAFVPHLDIPIVVVSDRVPSFYDLRTRGPRAAVLEMLAVRRAITRLSGGDDGFVFEKGGWRRHLLLGATGRRSWCPIRRRNVYEDRRDVLNTVFDDAIALESARRLAQAPRTVTINPASRVESKALSPRTLGSIVTHLQRRSIDVRLLDPERKHGSLKHAVSEYHTDTTLEQAVALVESCDLYIGADSLFVHVAYQRRTPMLVLYNETNLYFAPPGVAAQGTYLEFVGRKSAQELSEALDEQFAHR
jgi:ADP-heptose:LPS heptosyltransferase